MDASKKTEARFTSCKSHGASIEKSPRRAPPPRYGVISRNSRGPVETGGGPMHSDALAPGASRDKETEAEHNSWPVSLQ